ncbi:uncharacterized protein LOC106142169 isoform X2 [Amyelois transitella]|uniref:uncharacterized protein LOC106142169 isoform X2 n=1 Tax=Amyelois transitella TaxID=680683 RepID=UPI00067B4F1D|nr:uncharacterized protein LOC106142169 isoform X2 [Amyelois transitella]
MTRSKDVQKRWRSIRDSYTKAYRQGKCVPPEMCAPGSRRYQHHKQMAFLLNALKNKKPRFAQDKYESFSEVSNSSHPPPEDIIKIKNESIDIPLDLKTKPDIPERPETMDKSTSTDAQDIKIEMPTSEIKIDANSILPEDHFDDDKLFMNSLVPFFKKMNDDTRLKCRIEVLKTIRYALQGHKCFQTLKLDEDSFFTSKNSRLCKDEPGDNNMNTSKSSESKLSMVTRSADGTRTTRKRKGRSPSPLPVPAKKRGPGRPRKIRLPPSDSDEEQAAKKRPKLKVAPIEPLSEMDDILTSVSRVDQLSTPLFMKVYNLSRSVPSKPTRLADAMEETVSLDPKTQPC